MSTRDFRNSSKSVALLVRALLLWLFASLILALLFMSRLGPVDAFGFTVASSLSLFIAGVPAIALIVTLERSRMEATWSAVALVGLACTALVVLTTMGLGTLPIPNDGSQTVFVNDRIPATPTVLSLALLPLISAVAGRFLAVAQVFAGQGRRPWQLIFATTLVALSAAAFLLSRPLGTVVGPKLAAWAPNILVAAISAAVALLDRGARNDVAALFERIAKLPATMFASVIFGVLWITAVLFANGLRAMDELRNERFQNRANLAALSPVQYRALIPIPLNDRGGTLGTPLIVMVRVDAIPPNVSQEAYCQHLQTVAQSLSERPRVVLRYIAIGSGPSGCGFSEVHSLPMGALPDSVPGTTAKPPRIAMGRRATWRNHPIQFSDVAVSAGSSIDR